MRTMTSRWDIAFDVATHNGLLMLDIIEHLKEDPERFVGQLRRQFDYGTKKLVLTAPNAAFLVQRLMLLFGQFNYGKAGILDRTHTRLFTFRTIQRLLRDEGFGIVKVTGVPAPFPKVVGDGVLGKAMRRQSGSDPPQQLAVFVSDLSRSRIFAFSRVRARGLEAAKRGARAAHHVDSSTPA